MNNKIIGRDDACETFLEALESGSSEFIAIVGRRRIGKTFLVNNYFNDELCFYLTGVQDGSKETQLNAFTQELSRRQKKHVEPPKNWLDAFNMLRGYLEKKRTKKKKVIFLDELPWMDAPKSNFVQEFGYFWNSYAAWSKDIILVIAGSSTSWIVNKIFNDRGGLHNRVTKRIWLKPFTLQQTEDFLKSKKVTISRYEITLLYMAIGGIPFYLNEIKQGESAAQTIQRLFFKSGGLLKTEFQYLYKAIFFKADAYVRVVRILAKHRYGLNRTTLLKLAKITNSGGGSKILEDLVLTGYIEEMIPLGKNKNGAKYVLNDFYSLFYLNFVEPANYKNWLAAIETSSYKIWCGLSFERVCFMHQDEIKKTLGISGLNSYFTHLTLFGPNKKATSQIDMLIERADNVFNLCEIKFANSVYKIKETEATKLREKMADLQTKIKARQSIFPILVTPFGGEKNMHYIGNIQKEVTLNDLFVKR